MTKSFVLVLGALAALSLYACVSGAPVSKPESGSQMEPGIVALCVTPLGVLQFSKYDLVVKGTATFVSPSPGHDGYIPVDSCTFSKMEERAPAEPDARSFRQNGASN